MPEELVQEITPESAGRGGPRRNGAEWSGDSAETDLSRKTAPAWLRMGRSKLFGGSNCFEQHARKAFLAQERCERSVRAFLCARRSFERAVRNDTTVSNGPFETYLGAPKV